MDRSVSGVAKVLGGHNWHREAAGRGVGEADRDRDRAADRPAMEGPFGFCMFASTPGQVVSLDTFYLGRLQGVGAVWQLIAVGVATRIAVVKLEGILSDNGPEFAGTAFGAHVAELGLVHHRIPARSPNHHSVCERFHGTVADLSPQPVNQKV